MPIIGPQVYPGGWKVIDIEEVEVLLALQVPVRGWNMGPGIRNWWEYKGEQEGPWVAYRNDVQSAIALFFVRESSDDG